MLEDGKCVQEMWSVNQPVVVVYHKRLFLRGCDDENSVAAMGVGVVSKPFETCFKMTRNRFCSQGGRM